jgi:hypothetical protein
MAVCVGFMCVGFEYTCVCVLAAGSDGKFTVGQSVGCW